jgi:hypothetical protein
MCTAMLYDPKDHYEPEETKEFFEKKKTVLERLLRIKQFKFLKGLFKKDSNDNSPKAAKPKSLFHYFFNL